MQIQSNELLWKCVQVLNQNESSNSHPNPDWHIVITFYVIKKRYLKLVEEVRSIPHTFSILFQLIEDSCSNKIMLQSVMRVNKWGGEKHDQDLIFCYLHTLHFILYLYLCMIKDCNFILCKNKCVLLWRIRLFMGTEIHRAEHLSCPFLNFKHWHWLHAHPRVSKVAVVTGSGYFVPQTLTTYQAGSWPVEDPCLSLFWPVPVRTTQRLTCSSGRCYHDTRKLPQHWCLSTSRLLPALLSPEDKIWPLQWPIHLQQGKHGKKGSRGGVWRP